MLDFNGAEEQEDEPQDEFRRKWELQFIINEAVKLINNKIPTDREDLKKVARMASDIGIEIPLVVDVRIYGGQPAKKRRQPVKVSQLDGELRRLKRLSEYEFYLAYYGHKKLRIKPAHTNIPDRLDRLNAIAKDLNMPVRGLKSWEQLLTRNHKTHPRDKKQAII